MSAEDVRESGLLKDVVRLFHPEPSQAADITMLSAATASWRNFAQRWERYCITQNEPIVQPILVVQVQDGDSKNISKTNLSEVVDTVNSTTGTLPDSAFAHSFQEGTLLEFGPHKIRYIRPPDITTDYDVRIILFKTSLNTGWDCPRAEVMMSFRKAVDSTLIAQLVGRMVRTPLARRIDADEFLNSVALYLPHYDEAELRRVVDRLTTADPDILPPVPIQRDEDLATLVRATGSDKVFEELSSLPSYVIPRARKISGVRRLMKLSRLLANDDIRTTAVEDALGNLLQTLQREYERARVTANFQLIVRSRSKVRIRAVDWRMGGTFSKSETIELDIAKQNLDDLFEIAGRKLGEGLHKSWWRNRVETQGVGIDVAKLEIIALCVTPGVLDRVEQTSQSIAQKWLDEYRLRLNRLPDSRRQAYNEIRQLAKDPELTSVVYPDAIDVRRGNVMLANHIYVDDKEQFPAVLNAWETKVIMKELEDKRVIGWLRNFDRKEWSITIPYEDSAGRIRGFYPDFLIIRSGEDGLVVDMIEPHQTDLADAPAKARALAKYAEKHSNRFDRIEFVTVKDGKIRRLDMTEEAIREKVKSATTKEHLEQVFRLSGR